MNLNVLTDFSCSKRYYLTHPWKFIKKFFYNLRAARQRVTKGFANQDVWDFDSWFCSVVPPMLRHMANKGMAYPGKEPFDTPEKWHKWLYDMATKIERLQYDDWLNDNNEYSEDYHQTFKDEEYEENHSNGPFLTTTYGNSLTKKEIRENYHKRCKEIHETRKQVLEEFGKEFFKHFDCLWD